MCASNYKVLLLACSAAKLEEPAKAVDIYQGGIFCKGLEYAKREGLWVMILSAKYGLINWDHWVEPYNQKMKGNYKGPWPEMSGYYLGGQLYFKHAPASLQPLIPANTIGFMLRDLNRLLDGVSREELFSNG